MPRSRLICGSLGASALRLVLMTLAVCAACGAAAHDFDPANASIVELRAALDAQQISGEQLVRHYLTRIERLDHRGPHINALITLNPDALEQARRLDREAHARGDHGVLYGIPFIVKDNYDTAGIATSGGSAALKLSLPAHNAFVVQKLLDQGAVLLGKANMSELASSGGRLGYSSAGGLTLNPYNTARNVSGSSSGSAAAVAADFAPFALGSDTSGSIRGPASVAGLVGLRPTLGLASRSGIIPLSLTFDTAGALTRTVADQALVLEAIAGADPHDAATLHQPRPAHGYQALDAHTLQGVRLGVIGNFRGANPEVDAVEQTALESLRSQGAVLVPIALPEDYEHLWTLLMDPVGQAEFRPQFERYLRTLGPEEPKSLAQLIQISESPGVRDSATPVNPQRLQSLRLADSGELTDSPLYIRLLTEMIPSIRRRLEALAAEHELQAFVFSTLSCPASPRYDRDDPSYVCRTDDPYKASYLAAAAGFPEVTVPAGRIRGNLPVGYSFLGLPNQERQLLSLAAAFERMTPRGPPPVLP